MTDLGIRLAIRREGNYLKAYLARNDTMDGADLLGSLWLSALTNDEHFERWKSLMSDILADMIEGVFGQKPSMPERQAPEHERAGSA